MSVAAKDTNENKEKPITEYFEEFDQKLQSRLNDQESKINEKINSLKSPQKESDPEPDWSTAAGDDEEIVTKKDLKKILNESRNEFKKDAEKVIKSTLTTVSTKANRDQQAFEDFPVLNPKSKSYNHDFYSAVKKEINDRISRGRSAEDPDLIYDCAATVKATNPKFTRSIDEQARDQARQMDNLEANFSVRGGSTQTTFTPSARQVELGKNMGMSEEFLKEHFKKRG